MKKKKLLKRRKKEARRRKHYLDEAPLPVQKSAVYLIRRTEKQLRSKVQMFVVGQDLKLSDVIWTIHRSLGEGARFEIEPIVSGVFGVEPTCLHAYCNLDGRVFNEKMEVVRKGGR